MPEKTLGEIAVHSVSFVAIVLLMRRYGNLVVFGKSKAKKLQEKNELLTEIELHASKDIVNFIDEIYSEKLGKELRALNRKLSSGNISIEEYDTLLASSLESHYCKR